MRHGFDGHAVAGIVGTTISVGLQNFSTLAAGIAATLTGVYMLLRCVREWRRMKLDRKMILYEMIKQMGSQNVHPPKDQNP